MIDQKTPVTETPSLRIMIVDDIAQVRQDLQTMLMLSGNAAGLPIDVIGEAANGKQAVQLAAALRPEVILMDLSMPILDGYQATQLIKQNDPTCRVVALTVHDYEAARHQAVQSGADAVIIKGSSVELLIQAITSAGQDELDYD